MALTGDLKKWYFSSDGQLYDIAKMWATKFTFNELRAFQSAYAEYEIRHDITEEEYTAYNHMWQTATWAISIQCFGY
jgi:hypothetical protein